jgi:hypothetical protein
MLAAWNEDDLSSPILRPVELSMRAPPRQGLWARLTGSGEAPLDEAQIALLKDRVATEAESRRAENASRYTELANRVAALGGITSTNLGDNELLTYAIAAFDADELAAAKEAIDVLATRDQDRPETLAYAGAILAMRASEEAPLTALQTVTEAYVLLDRAVELAATDEEILASRYARANVSRSVPNSVFSKALSGAEDYIRISSLVKDDPEELARVYCGAAVCYETAGRTLDAGLWFRESSRLVKGLPDEAMVSDVRLELAKRRLP